MLGPTQQLVISVSQKMGVKRFSAGIFHNTAYRSKHSALENKVTGSKSYGKRAWPLIYKLRARRGKVY